MVTDNLLPWATKLTHPSQYSIVEYSGTAFIFGRIPYNNVTGKIFVPAKFSGLG